LFSEVAVVADRRKGSSRLHAADGHPDGTSQANKRSPLRNTGIHVAGDMPWGAHICLFYETKEDLLDTNVAYIKAGLGGNEFCVWALSDPVTQDDAKDALRASVPDFHRHMADGRVELLPGYDWYLKGGRFDSQKITGGWHEKLRWALDKGFEGLRISGNAFWLESNQWKEFCAYEQELDESLSGQPMIALCTYSLQASRAVDMLDVARAHQFTIVRRQGEWEFLETPELKQAKREIKSLSDALLVLSRSFPGLKLLTARERIVLAQIVRGTSSKEAARALAISPRTVEFHRANIMQKLHAKNAADLVRIVLG
jgi:DNA-binding CsgD family transcriptional regulator